MKTRKSRKLHLNRETLRSLEPQVLAGVQGADLGVVIGVTVDVTIQITIKSAESGCCPTRTCCCLTCPPCE